MTPGRRRLIAALYGLAAHGIFVAGVGAMVLNLHQGMRFSLGTAHGAAASSAGAVGRSLLASPRAGSVGRFRPRPSPPSPRSRSP